MADTAQRAAIATAVATALALATGMIGTGPTAATAARASTVPGAAPSAEASPSADPDLMAEAGDLLAEERERLSAVEITAEMTANATIALDPDDATFDLHPDDATTTLERTEETPDETVTTLTSDLLFEFGSADLTAPARAAVADLADAIPDGAEVTVDGHTDSVGTAKDNQKLSEQRAKAVAAVLRDERDDLDLTVRGHGEDDPVAKNEVDGEDNPAGRTLNRRVEVTYPTP